MSKTAVKYGSVLKGETRPLAWVAYMNARSSRYGYQIRVIGTEHNTTDLGV